MTWLKPILPREEMTIGAQSWPQEWPLLEKYASVTTSDAVSALTVDSMMGITFVQLGLRLIALRQGYGQHPILEAGIHLVLLDLRA